MSGRGKVRVGFVVTLGLAVTAVAAARGLPVLEGPSGPESAPPGSVVVRVETEAVLAAPAEAFRAYGTTRAQSRAILSFPAAGRLADRPIGVGERVVQGQVLAVLDPAPFQNAVALARASEQEVEHRLEQLERDRARVGTLYREGVVSQSEFETIESEQRALAARREQTLVQVLEAERAQRDAVLRAPYSGLVSAVHLMPKEYAAPGTPVLELSGDDGLEVKVQVAEGARRGLALSTPVTVDFPLLGLSGLPGRITQLGDDSERSFGLFPVVVRLEDPRLSAGLSAEVSFQTGAPGGLSVPLEAVINRTGRVPYVFRLSERAGGKLAERVPVRLLDLRGDRLLVESTTERKLRLGDQVITGGHAQVTGQTPVEVD